MLNKKGFTLIELLAVIIILAVLLLIAIPAVSNYINDSRKEAYVKTAKQVISGARNLVNSGKLDMYDTDTTYYIPSSCIKVENGETAKSPYGEFIKAYVAVTYSGKDYDYYWASVDESGIGFKSLLCSNNLSIDDLSSGVKIEDIKSDYPIGGRSNYRVYDDNCTEYVEGKNIASFTNTIEKLIENSSSNTIVDEFRNIRFIGRNPSNYVKFEDSDKKWRIIGIVDGHVKIVDDTVNVTTVNGMTSWWRGYGSYDKSIMDNWSTSKAMSDLNGDYYNSLSDLTKKSIITFTYGLENSHINDDKVNVYNRERAAANSSDSSKKWTGKVASIYASDFLFSHSTPVSYNTSWISDDYWRFWRNSGVVCRAFLPLNGGWIGTAAPNDYVVLPTVYLSKSLVVKSGNGSSNNPYIISLSDYDEC